jgi:hypothetical protein
MQMSSRSDGLKYVLLAELVYSKAVYQVGGDCKGICNSCHGVTNLV